MKLRPMLMSDADKMLEWKNYPETRQFSIQSKDEIKREDHYKWLEKNIQYFQVIHDGDTLVGAFRIQDNEISIWVDRAFRGQKVALKTLNQVATKHMKAKIVAGNIASLKTFIRAGFEPQYFVEGYYLFMKP